MFTECHDANTKFPSYINCDRVIEMHVRDIANEDNSQIFGYAVEAYIVLYPDNKRIISQVFKTQDEAQTVLDDLVKKLNKHKK